MDFAARTEEIAFTPEQEAELLAAAEARAAEDLHKVDAAEGDEMLFYALPRGAMAAFRLGEFDRAKELASRALALAPSFRGNWNFGNAIHAAHTVLGLLALRNDDLPTAVSELHQAGATPGSPQLNSFGPTMELAKALLRTGEVSAVLEYFGQCRSFWKMGTDWLDVWEKKVKAGSVPNFFLHCYR